MADKSDERRVKTVQLLQGVASTLTKSYNEARVAKDQYLADGGNAAFTEAWFTAQNGNLGITYAEFDALRTVVVALLAWVEDQNRLSTLQKVRAV